MKLTNNAKAVAHSFLRLILFFLVLATLIPAPVSDISQKYDVWNQFSIGIIPLVIFFMSQESTRTTRLASTVIGVLGYFCIMYMAVEAWNINLKLLR